MEPAGRLLLVRLGVISFAQKVRVLGWRRVVVEWSAWGGCGLGNPRIGWRHMGSVWEATKGRKERTKCVVRKCWRGTKSGGSECGTETRENVGYCRV